MIKLRQTVIVEGKYDAIKLRGILDCNILTTNGFRIFSDKERRALIRRIALKDGIILLTDSDRAGARIRGYISGFVPADCIRQVYIPKVAGKEPRKAAPSSEGTLGVEGMDDETLLRCLERAGITPEGTASSAPSDDPITGYDLYELGFSGRTDSQSRKHALMTALEFPTAMSSAALLRALNILYTREAFLALVRELHL